MWHAMRLGNGKRLASTRSKLGQLSIQSNPVYLYLETFIGHPERAFPARKKHYHSVVWSHRVTASKRWGNPVMERMLNMNPEPADSLPSHRS